MRSITSVYPIYVDIYTEICRDLPLSVMGTFQAMTNLEHLETVVYVGMNIFTNFDSLKIFPIANTWKLFNLVCM